MTAWPMCAHLRCAYGTDHTAQPKCDCAHWDCGCDCLTMVKVDSACCILGKGVPFVPVTMQHGATEDVLLWQKCALCATRMRDVRDRGARCARTLHPSLQPTEDVSPAARWCEYLNPSLYWACNTSYVRSAFKYTCMTRTETVLLYTLVAPQV